MVDDKLLGALLELKSDFADCAQTIYDRWNQDPEGYCSEFGLDNIASELADALIEIVVAKISAVETKRARPTSQDHIYAVVRLNDECYDIDVPYYLYSTQLENHCWLKVEDVEITEDDVLIEASAWDDYNEDDQY